MKYLHASLFLIFSLSAMAQSRLEIQVINAENEVLTYASVLLKGTIFGKTTDSEGKVVFENVPFGKHQLVVAYLGYLSFEQKIARSVECSLLLRSDNFRNIVPYSCMCNKKIWNLVLNPFPGQEQGIFQVGFCSVPTSNLDCRYFL